jgi:hypothetical protein
LRKRVAQFPSLHDSNLQSMRNIATKTSLMAEGAGFEPAAHGVGAGFQDRWFQPLTHPSRMMLDTYEATSSAGESVLQLCCKIPIPFATSRGFKFTYRRCTAALLCPAAFIATSTRTPRPDIRFLRCVDNRETGNCSAFARPRAILTASVIMFLWIAQPSSRVKISPLTLVTIRPASAPLPHLGLNYSFEGSCMRSPFFTWFLLENAGYVVRRYRRASRYRGNDHQYRCCNRSAASTLNAKR